MTDQYADLVKRLRAASLWFDAREYEAADAIEALETEIGKMQHSSPLFNVMAENARLREALIKLIEWYDRDGSHGTISDVFGDARIMLGRI